jgi:membrane-associated phospholipid phosphatase
MTPPSTATSAELAPGRPRLLAPNRARWLTVGGLLAFIAASVALVATEGLILSRDWLFAWLLLGLLAVSLADVKRWARGVIVDWLPLMAVLLLYDLSKPVSEWLGTRPHVLPQLDLDRWLTGGAVPTVWLQHSLHRPGVAHWYDDVAFFVYLSHFFVTLAVAAALWRLAYPRFKRFRTLVVGLATAGFVTYVLFPAVPPWLAAWEGHIAPVDRLIAGMWGHVGLQPAQALFENHGEFYNQVAALPSLHAAYPMLLLLFFWRDGRWARLGLGLYVLAMGFTLVYTGEHYLTDLLVGWGYAGGVFATVAALGRRRERLQVEQRPQEREGHLGALA